MIKTILLIAVFTALIYPQLKQMEVKQTVNRGQIPVLIDYPDKAAVFFYSAFDNLSFHSSYGIHKQYDRGPGNYAIVIEPGRQAIEIRCPGYKTEIIRMKDMSPGEVVYYTVEVKKEEYTAPLLTDISVSFQVTPHDAIITVDSIITKNDTPTKLLVGTHKLRVTKEGFNEHNEEITVNSSNTLFKVNLATRELVTVTINSFPPAAEIFIDGMTRGKTKKSMFLYPGSYELKLSLEGYVPSTEKITISSDEKLNNFNYNIIKNAGFIKVETTPTTAIVKLNSKIINGNLEYELPPGIYVIEAEANTYSVFKDTIKLEVGKTVTEKINLNKNTGIVRIEVIPATAKVILNGKLVAGNQDIELPPGAYLLEAEANTYFPYKKSISIEIGKTVVEKIILSKNTGVLKFEVTPKDAIVKINKEVIDASIAHELTPGTYQLEAESNTYYTYKNTIKIELNDSKTETIVLKRKEGKLQFSITPAEAECTLTQNGVEKYSWTGLKIISPIPQGSYTLKAKTEGYKTYNSQIEITENQTTIEDIQMETGYDKPPISYHGDFFAMLSMPIGNFAANTVANEKSGFAKMGFGGSYEFANRFFLGKSIKWVLAASYMNIGYDSEALQQIRRDYWKSDSLTIQVANYSIATIQAGLQIGKEFDDFYPYISLTGGMLASFAPDIKENNEVTTFSTGVSYCYGFGVGVKFWDRLNVVVKYTASEPQYTAKNSRGEFNIKSSISVINIMLGISL